MKGGRELSRREPVQPRLAPHLRRTGTLGGVFEMEGGGSTTAKGSALGKQEGRKVTALPWRRNKAAEAHQ